LSIPPKEYRQAENHQCRSQGGEDQGQEQEILVPHEHCRRPAQAEVLMSFRSSAEISSVQSPAGQFGPTLSIFGKKPREVKSSPAPEPVK
jgi:hypothetical protein